jgi:hypothetical protein
MMRGMNWQRHWEAQNRYDCDQIGATGPSAPWLAMFAWLATDAFHDPGKFDAMGL